MLPWPSRPAGAHIVYAVRWRGHRQLCTCRLLGGATCSVGPITDRGITSSAYRASVVATCSAGGKWNRNSHPGALPEEMPKITSTQPQGRTGDFRQGAGRWGRPDYKQAIAGSRGRILAASSTCHPGQVIQAWWRGCLHQLKIPLFRYSHPEHPVLLVGKPPSVDVGWVSAGGA